MMEATERQVGDAGAAALQIGLVLGDQNLSVAGEAAIIVDQFGNIVPERHRGVGERDFRDVARELAHAAGIDAGSVTPGMVLLYQDDREPAHRAVHSGRAAMDAAADDDDIGAAPAVAHRTTAVTEASVCGRAASSASVTGLIGGRRR